MRACVCVCVCARACECVCVCEGGGVGCFLSEFTTVLTCSCPPQKRGLCGPTSAEDDSISGESRQQVIG